MRNPWKRLGELPAAIWVLAGATLVNRAGTMALPFLTLYLTRDLGVRAEDAGFALTCYGVGMIVTAPFAGMLSDAVGPLRVMTVSLLLSALIVFSVPLVSAFPLVFTLVFLWSLVGEAFRPASMAIITDLVPADALKAAFTLNRVALNLGMSVGPAVGGFLFLWSPKALFWVDASTSVVAGAVLLAAATRVGLRRDHVGVRRMAGMQGGEQGTFLAAIADRRLLYFLGSLFPVFLVFFQHASAMPLFLVRDLRLPESAYGIMFTVNTAMIITIEVPLNMATLQVPHRVMLPLGALLVGFGFGGLMFVTSIAGFIATVVIWTFGEMIIIPVASTYLGEIAPRDQRGRYMGIFQMSFGLAFAAAAWGGTAVLDHFGGNVLWAATFVAALVSALTLSRVRGS